MSSSILSIVNQFLVTRLDAKALAFAQATQAEIAGGISNNRFSALVSLASRHIPRKLLAPVASESELAQSVVPGWSPEAWSVLEAVRVSFVLARPDLANADFSDSFNAWFTYADEGEACAYYRALPFLPEPQRFTWRAAEGCRTNMRTIFMSVACDSPYPAHYFDDVAWNQLVVKALFTETPLRRVYGLDQRLSPTLAAMVLDYMDERRSAGRSIPLDSWLCLGAFEQERVGAAVDTALSSVSMLERAGAIIALSRAGAFAQVKALQDANQEPQLVPLLQQAAAGFIDQHTINNSVATLGV